MTVKSPLTLYLFEVYRKGLAQVLGTAGDLIANTIWQPLGYKSESQKVVALVALGETLILDRSSETAATAKRISLDNYT